MDRIVLEEECRQITSLSPRERRGAEREGTFPSGVRLPDGTIGWLESDLQLWIKTLTAGPFALTPPPWFTRSCAAAAARRTELAASATGGGSKPRRRRSRA